MKEAVEFLSNSDESYQHCGASFIQHSTFMDDKSKDEVLILLCNLIMNVEPMIYM